MLPIPFFFFLKFFLLFIFGYAGSSLLGRLSSCSKTGLLFVGAHGLLIAVASLVAEHGFRVWTQSLQLMGLIAPRHVGVFPDQGSNLCPLHCQVES